MDGMQIATSRKRSSAFEVKNAMHPMRVLFADDDSELRSLIRLILKNAAIEGVFAENGLHALELWRNNPVDLIILDLMMPNMDGLETCRFIRRVSNVPVIMLTAKTQEKDILRGFEAGADDYIMKPFRPKELVARIWAIQQRAIRSYRFMEEQVVFEDLALDKNSRRVMLRGRDIPLSPVEFRLLNYLMQNCGAIVSKGDLLQNVWGYVNSAGDLNLIEAAVKRLRRKIEPHPSIPHYIHTVWGVGYRFGNK